MIHRHRLADVRNVSSLNIIPSPTAVCSSPPPLSAPPCSLPSPSRGRCRLQLRAEAEPPVALLEVVLWSLSSCVTPPKKRPSRPSTFSSYSFAPLAGKKTEKYQMIIR